MSERVCWICFMSESETPSHVRWISPCRCIGDTSWSHEPCLFTWIIRKQSERINEGRPAAVIIHEDTPAMPGAMQLDFMYPARHVDGDQLEDDLTGSLVMGSGEMDDMREYSPVFRQRMETRLRMIAEYGDRLIKCPQCSSPYEIQLQPRSFASAVFMDLYLLFSQLGDYIVPYAVVAGGSFLVVNVSTAVGMFLCVTVCGPDDLLVGHLTGSLWGWREWVGVNCIPYMLGLATAKVSSRNSLVSALFTLTSVFGVIPALQKRQLITSNLEILPSSNPSSIRSLVNQRLYFFLGSLGLKYAYAYVIDTLLTPLMVGYRKPLQQQEHSNNNNSNNINNNSERVSTESLNDQFNSYLTEDLIENPQNTANSTSLFSIGKSVVSIITLPIISSLAGNILKYAATSLVQSSIPQQHQWIKVVLEKTGKFDKFTWTFMGGFAYTFVKDIATLLYNRQRKLQRKKMHVLNYRQR